VGPWSPLESFVSVQLANDPSFTLKWKRAYHHFSQAQAVIAKFLNSHEEKPYEVTQDQGSEPGKLLVWLTLRKEPPDVSLAVGDSIHNARSALDHIVYAISSRQEPNPTFTAFPIQTVEAHWDRGAKRGKLAKSSGEYQTRLLPAPAREIIKELQPWPGRNPPHLDRERLELLHKLDIADKHKKLNLLVTYLQLAAYGARLGEAEAAPPLEYFSPTVTLQLNTPILLFRFADPKVLVQPIPRLDITLTEGGRREVPVVRQLNEILDCVRRVLGQLEVFI
jgi:hypothetical protein